MQGENSIEEVYVWIFLCEYLILHLFSFWCIFSYRRMSLVKMIILATMEKLAWLLIAVRELLLALRHTYKRLLVAAM